MTINKIPYFDPFSFSPDLKKASVGFEQVLNKIQEAVDKVPKTASYPPYNIRKVDENKYVIEIAVAGFGTQDIEIEFVDGTLVVKGQVNTDTKNEDYLFKGIADRAFTRTFSLADHVVVKNADMLNGMLKIWLEHIIPEEKKPRKIEIKGSEGKSKSE